MVAVVSPPALPENVVSLDVAERTWNGVQFSVSRFSCGGEVVLLLPHQHQARLGAILEELGGASEARSRPDQPCSLGHVPRYLHYSPAGQEIWGHTNARRVVDAMLAFDFDVLSERLSMRFDPDRIDVPLSRFSNDCIWTLVKLLADALHNPDPSTQLYGDDLVTAITSQIFAAPQMHTERIGKLAPWQLRRVSEFMDSHFPNRIDLETLAAQINLSQAHFSRAFKASTGLAPYQWQLDVRIKRAQQMLGASDASMADIAQATGFADTVHFGRTFRKMVGVAQAHGAYRTKGD